VAEIKSALMLTSFVGASSSSPGSPGLTDQCASLDSGNNCVASTGLPSPQVRGAGRIDVDAANRVGVLLDESGADYEAANPDDGGDLTALNLASLASSECAESCVWRRTFTSPFKHVSEHITLSASHLSSGLSMHFSPASFTLAPGASATVTFTADDPNVTHGKWSFAQVNLSVGSGIDDNGDPISAMHMPVVAQSVAPTAHMRVDVTSLDYSVGAGASTKSFTLFNNGQRTLDWTLSSSGGALQSAAAATSAAPVLDDSAIWTQPQNTDQSGFPSTLFTQTNHGVYSADTFSLPVSAHISQIATSGFAQDGTGAVLVSGKVDWYVYADASGKPAGNPEDGKADYEWHYSGTAGSMGIDTTAGVITLDLAAAGQPDFTLSAGSYWLIVVPSMDSRESDANAATWFWFEGKSPNGATSAMIDDPSGGLGHGNGWAALDSSLEFTLRGSLVCSSGDMPGLTISPTSGSVPAGDSAVVKVTMSGAGLKNGKYGGAVCLSGNASDHPNIALTVTATVSGNSSGGGTNGGGNSGGGGGGELGLLEILLLGLLARRRHATS
jgi:hypothetical protein